MKFRLQLSVAVAFALLTTVVLGVAVTFFFLSNRELAIETARDAMSDARAHVDSALMGEITPVVRLVDSTGRFVREYPADVGQGPAIEVMKAGFAKLQNVYSVFVAVEGNGTFIQVARVLPGMTEFGMDKVPIPAGTVWIHRQITQSQAGGVDWVRFIDADGKVIRASALPTPYDPRNRPWYEAARADDNTVVSAPYVFSSTGRPGVTFSNRVTDADGNIIAVVGVDMTLDSVTDLLSRLRVDGLGEVFLLARTGDLIATSEAGEADRLTDKALAAWDGQDGAFFQLKVPGVQGGYLVSMAGMTPLLGTQPILGVIVPQRHFVGGIITNTRRVLMLSALVGLVSVLVTVLLSRMLSKSLRNVATEAHRISAFDLTGTLQTNSRITEVADLAAAMDNMKNSLTSFGAYVPKDVVRSIVASGGRVAVGGVSRELSIMFSDIEGFTRKSEALPPERVTSDLSRYFEAMAQAVTQNRGTVDKYIGDAVMALWNAPAELADHAAAACHGALACKQAEAALNAAAEPGGIFPVRTRIGLHCDTVVVGNVGSANRLQYTAIGGAVNLASRVEGLNKVYGTDILATQAIVDRVGDRFLFREVDLVSPAGTSRPVALHALIGRAADADDALRLHLARWSEAIALYRAREWAGAAAAFDALDVETVGPKLRSLYLDRCARFHETPPPATWAGVTVLNEK